MFRSSQTLHASIVSITAVSVASFTMWGQSFGTAGDWRALRQKAADAIQGQDLEAATGFYQQSALVAQSAVQRGLSYNDLGVTLHQMARDAEARPHLENALRIWQQSTGQEEKLSETAATLASVNRALGDYGGAETAWRAALLTPPAGDDSRALLLNGLGNILQEVGQGREARGLYEKALALRTITPRRRADSLMGLADLDRDARNWQASFEGWNQAAGIAREHDWALPEAAALRGMGVTYLEHGEAARAEPLLRNSLALFERENAPIHQISSTLTCLGQLYFAEGKYGMSEDVLERALRIGEKSLGENHPQIAVILEMMGNAAAGRKQLDVARQRYQRARLIMVTRLGEQSPVAAAVDAGWAMIEHRASRNVQAAAHFERALAILNNAGPDSQGLRDTVAQQYAEVCKALHRKPGPAANALLPQTK